MRTAADPRMRRSFSSTKTTAPKFSEFHFNPNFTEGLAVNPSSPLFPMAPITLVPAQPARAAALRLSFLGGPAEACNLPSVVASMTSAASFGAILESFDTYRKARDLFCTEETSLIPISVFQTVAAFRIRGPRLPTNPSNSSTTISGVNGLSL
jgi:hypothetical protein